MTMQENQVHIAIVRSDKYRESYDHRTQYELSRLFKQVASKYERLRNVQVSVEAWDVQTDWRKFSHILLSDGIEYADCHEKFLKWLNGLPEDIRGRVINPISLINWNINKTYLYDLSQQGISIAPSVFIKQNENILFEEAIQQLEKKTGRNLQFVVVKPFIGADGVNAYKINATDNEHGTKCLQKCIESQVGVIVQEYLPSIVSEGEWSLVFINGDLTHALRKNPNSGEFKVQDTYGGSALIVDLNEVPVDIIDFAKKVAKNIEHFRPIYGRIDMVRGNDGHPCLMELEAFEPELFLSNEELVLKFLDSILQYTIPS